MDRFTQKKKKLLIIYPNWIPSNAVGVQRVRLIVNYLKEFDWEPVILAVDPTYYEEEKSGDLDKLVNKDIRVEFVCAKNAGKLRLYGDIALRAFGNLKHKAIAMVKNEQFDCLWVPIPPFYTALIARKVHDVTGVPYVVDYIDPWVHDFPGSNQFFSRARLASAVAHFLEPIAVKKASGFTGVSEAYFLPVLERNRHLKLIPYRGMPYGFDANDYNIKPGNNKLLWADDGDIIPYIYAGAFLPNAHYFIEKLFQVLVQMIKNGTINKKIRFYFVGTGKTNLRSIADYANEYELQDIIRETKERIPYLEVLNNLSNAAGVLAVGSTEQHYTASKIFQSILSRKPIFAIFHKDSTVVDILKDTDADTYLVKYNEADSKLAFADKLGNCFKSYLDQSKGWKPTIKQLDQYSARTSAGVLVEVLNTVINKHDL